MLKISSEKYLKFKICSLIDRPILEQFCCDWKNLLTSLNRAISRSTQAVVLRHGGRLTEQWSKQAAQFAQPINLAESWKFSQTGVRPNFFSLSLSCNRSILHIFPWLLRSSFARQGIFLSQVETFPMLHEACSGDRYALSNRLLLLGKHDRVTEIFHQLKGEISSTFWYFTCDDAEWVVKYSNVNYTRALGLSFKFLRQPGESSSHRNGKSEWAKTW